MYKVVFLLISVICYCFNTQVDFKPNGCKGVTLCSSNPTNDGKGLYLDIGFMYCKPRVSGAIYAHTNDTNITFMPNLSGMTMRPNIEADWGIIAGGGYYFDHDQWVARVSFNYLQASTTECLDCVCDDDYFVPDGIWCHDIMPQLFTHYNPAFTDEVPYSTFNVRYYLLEEALAKGTFLSKNMAFEPYFGIKTIWLEFFQKSCFKHVQAYGNCCSIFPDQLEPYWADFVHRVNSKFWGIGPHVGLNSSWYIDQCPNASNQLCSLFTDFDAALLIGRTQSSDELDVDGNLTIQISNDYNLMSPALRLTMGLLFERSMNDAEQNFSCKIGWDNAVYFNQFTTNCYTNICGLKTNENNIFSMTGLLVDFSLSF